jgi:PAS domain-containing protein
VPPSDPHRDARPPDVGAGAPVLGRLLSALVVLEALPTTAKMAEFLTAALLDVPGVTGCEVRLGPACVPVEEPLDSSDPHHFTVRVETGGRSYGAFVFEIESEAAAAPYRPFLTNLGASVALLSENRWQRSQLERVLAEVQVSEERYRGLFEAMLEGFSYCRMLYDDQGQAVDWIYLAVNPAFEQLSGLDNVTGRRVTEAIPGVRESSPELFEIYGRVVATGVPERFQIEFTPLSLWLDISVVKPADGCFVAVFENITARKKAEADRERLIDELRKTLDEVKTLRGFIPICASCKKIRDDEGYWTQVETYISEHSNAEFSHGICPECMGRLYPR